MGITDYQIRSVLRSYTRHLCRIMEKEFDGQEAPWNDFRKKRTLRIKGKLTHMIDKVLSEMVKSIVKEKRKVVGKMPEDNGREMEYHENGFSYSVLDEQNRRRTYRFSLQESDFVISRIDPDKEP